MPHTIMRVALFCVTVAVQVVAATSEVRLILSCDPQPTFLEACFALFNWIRHRLWTCTSI